MYVIPGILWVRLNLAFYFGNNLKVKMHFSDRMSQKFCYWPWRAFQAIFIFSPKVSNLL